MMTTKRNKNSSLRHRIRMKNNSLNKTEERAIIHTTTLLFLRVEFLDWLSIYFRFLSPPKVCYTFLILDLVAVFCQGYWRLNRLKERRKLKTQLNLERESLP
jgi:hypothetical protein